MKTETVVKIIDHGRGPQLSTSRITVMDVFYWVHRGNGWDEIHEVMSVLTREEFDLVMEYINRHRDELIEKDRRAEEYQEQRIAEQHARGGIFAPPEENLAVEERVARLKEKIRQKQAGANGEGHPGGCSHGSLRGGARS